MLERPKEFEMHALKQFSMSGFAVNSWIRFKTPTINVVSPNGQSTLIGALIEQDINTLAEEMASNNFSGGDFGKFYSVLPSICEQILGLYLPG